MTRHLQLT